MKSFIFLSVGTFEANYFRNILKKSVSSELLNKSSIKSKKSQSMDRNEQVANVKKLESDFVNKIEDLIKNKYLDYLFVKYRQSIHEIKECYQDPTSSLLKAKECAKSSMDKYHEKEKRFEQLFSLYEVNFL